MQKTILFACLALALIAALGYILMGAGVIQAGNLTTDDAPPVIGYVIGGCYAVGGFLVLLKRRWLLITGAAINGFAIVIFYLMYAGQPDVITSAPGLITKIAQVPLEAGLIYLIRTFRRREIS